MLLRRQRSAAEIAHVIVPGVYLALMLALPTVVNSEQSPTSPGEQMPPSAPMPQGVAPPSANAELQERMAHEGGLSAEKRGWADMQHGWGKRGWADLRSAWGKRDWRDLQPAWGKRDWNSMKGAWGKRSWDNFRGSWGKRSAGEWGGGGGGYMDGGYPEDEDSIDLGPNGIAYDDGPQRDGSEYGPEGYEGKRSWGNLKGAWGKRAYASDEDGLDEMEAELAEHYGDPDKRAWRNFKGSWGKRDPGWHNLKGLWGKRSAGTKWNKLTSVWGKRSVGGETGLKTMDAPSGV